MNRLWLLVQHHNFEDAEIYDSFESIQKSLADRYRGCEIKFTPVIPRNSTALEVHYAGISTGQRYEQYHAIKTRYNPDPPPRQQRTPYTG